jgi:NAD(P)-dependent dehydrogenase (short-subunit alcohol dehydrogenase family)
MSEPNLRTFQGAVAIITGGASGIGRALAEELASRGAEVVLADLQADLAAEAAAHIRANGGKARAEPLDVTDFAAVDRLVQETVATSGRLDYLFNNAGIVVAGEAHLYQIQDWNQVIKVNLCGVANGVQAAYTIMRRQGFGHVVNTASIAGLIPQGGLLSYSASKHAVVGLSTSLRIEAELVGVRVSVLCPGAVETAIVGGGKYGKHLRPVPERIQRQVWESFRPIASGDFAQKALDAIAKNKAIIVLPLRWRALWWLYRVCPILVVALARHQFVANKKRLEDNLSAS